MDEGTAKRIDVAEPGSTCPATSPADATPAGTVVLKPEDSARLLGLLARPADAILLDAVDVARVLCLSLRSVRRMDRFGEIPQPIRIGGRAVRWRRDELVAWCAAGCPKRRSWTWQPPLAADADCSPSRRGL